jgi:hypothetical protein
LLAEIEEGMEADDLLCSRNARSMTPLVGRAQWKINQPPLPEKITSKLGGNIGVGWWAFDVGT